MAGRIRKIYGIGRIKKIHGRTDEKDIWYVELVRFLVGRILERCMAERIIE